MKMDDQFHVTSTITSSSPSTPLRPPSSHFYGDFSIANKFSDYSPSSSLSNGFYSPEDSSTPFASPPFNGIIPNHKSVNVNDDDSLSLCEDLYRMKFSEDLTEEKEVRYGENQHGSVFLSDYTDPVVKFSPKRNGVSGGGLFRPTKESSSDLWFNNNNSLGFGRFENKSDSSIANSQQIGWPSSNTNGLSPYHEIFGNGLIQGATREYYRPATTSDMLQPWFSHESQVPMVSKSSEPFSFDDSFLDHQSEICHSSLPNGCEIQGHVYSMAKDQHGCRFLQRIFDEGTSVDAMIIFNEVIAHVVELMMDPFGNYLMQKLLDVCTEEQRTQIVLVATSEPGQLIRISLNAYGTRVVQRLVETIRTGKQISLVKSALRPGFLDLIKDLNGNHVIQRCLQCLSTEDNKFIFEAATRFCTEIATHRHGCCVLQKCIAHSMRQQREKLIAEISRNSLLLAQDPFGNYAVQFVIELRIPSAIAMMLAQLKGHYVQLSMQKFSSHMVERCLTYCPESRPQIVRELISFPHFDQLLQDPYANFVIQAALLNTKGPLHASLVDVIRPHSILRNNPYCKRIFSRNLLKK